MDWKAGFDTTFSDVLTARNVRRLVGLWLVGIFVLVVYGVLSARFGETPVSSLVHAPAAGESETRAFVIWRRNPNDAGQPTCKVAFDDLRAENGSLGLFRTAAYKVMCVDNLEVTFRRLATGPDEPARLREFQDLFASSRGGSQAGILADLRRVQDEMADWDLSLDLTNTTEVQVNRMDWRVYRDDQIVFRIQCRQARLPGRKPEILLRGHARVAVCGATLESNCIRMDSRRERFIVDGRYLLVRDGVARTGVGASFDTDLRILEDTSSS